MYCEYIFYFYLLLLFEWMLICIFLLSDSGLKLYKNVINIELCGIKSIFMLCVIFYIGFLLYIRNGDWFEIIIWNLDW